MTFLEIDNLKMPREDLKNSSNTHLTKLACELALLLPGCRIRYLREGKVIVEIVIFNQPQELL